MKFPTMKEYMKLVRALREMDNLRLCSGNCGAYALALKKMFGVGKLMAFSDERGFVHVLLKYRNRYYDGETIYKSIEDLKNSKWGHLFETRRFIDIEEEWNTSDFKELCKLMERMTCYYTEASEFVPIIESNYGVS